MTSVSSAFPAAGEPVGEAVDPPAGTLLRIDAGHEGDALVLTVYGEIDLCSAGRLTSLARAALAEHTGLHNRLVLDLARVEFFGAAGYRELAEIQLLAESVGCVCAIRDPSPAVRRVFALLPLAAGLFALEPSALSDPPALPLQ